MDLNATILGQMISFILFVLFCMKYIWPNITTAITYRKKKIISERFKLEKYKQDIEILKKKSMNILHDAKKKSVYIIQKAKQESNIILENGKKKLQQEKKKIILKAEIDINLQKKKIKSELEKEITSLAMIMVNKILHQSTTNNLKQENIINMLIKNL